MIVAQKYLGGSTIGRRRRLRRRRLTLHPRCFAAYYFRVILLGAEHLLDAEAFPFSIRRTQIEITAWLIHYCSCQTGQALLVATVSLYSSATTVLCIAKGALWTDILWFLAF
jgi:hypothetical protein